MNHEDKDRKAGIKYLETRRQGGLHFAMRAMPAMHNATTREASCQRFGVFSP